MLKPDIAIHSSKRFDLVVVGTGPAGLAAAAEVAHCNGSVIVFDEGPFPGGRLRAQMHEEPAATGIRRRKWFNGSQQADRLVNEATSAGAEISCGVSVWGVFPGWYVAVAPVDGRNRCPAGIEARALVIATGAVQNPVPLKGWTLAGVITAGAAQTLLNVYHVLPGRRAVVIGTDPLALSVARLLALVGADVQGVFLPPPNGIQFGPCSTRSAVAELVRLSAFAASRRLSILGRLAACGSGLAARCFPRRGLDGGGFPLRLRQAAIAVEGTRQVESVRVAPLNSDGNVKTTHTTRVAADVVVTSGGLSPLSELAQLTGCPLVFISKLGGWVPLHGAKFETPVPGVFVAGSMTGVEGAGVAEAQGRLAGSAAAAYLGLIGQPEMKARAARFRAMEQTARQGAIAFYRDIAGGRARMARYWKLQARKQEN
jgi:sarcosine oxidase subunit alpha